jgi:hypothetical protein
MAKLSEFHHFILLPVLMGLVEATTSAFMRLLLGSKNP